MYLDDVEIPVLLCGGSHGPGRVLVVGVEEGDDVVGAGVQPRHEDGGLVRLRAGAGYGWGTTYEFWRRPLRFRGPIWNGRGCRAWHTPEILMGL